MASYKDNKFPLGGEIIHQAKGEIITSELKLMSQWKWSKSKVRNFLSALENNGMIVKITDHKKTAINIVNYSVYQDMQTTERPIEDRCFFNDEQNTVQKTHHKKTASKPVNSSFETESQTTERPQKDRAETAKRPQTVHNQQIEQSKQSNNIKDISMSAKLTQAEELKTLYAELCFNLPSVKSLTDKRKKAITTLLKQMSIDDIKFAFIAINTSSFCCGVNNRGWKADFDFCIKPDNLTKALEGKYDDRNSNISRGAEHKDDYCYGQYL